MKIKGLFFALLASLYAGASIAEESSSQWIHVFSLSGGPAWVNTPLNSQTFSLQNDITKTYTINKQKQTLPAAELFAGWQRGLNNYVNWQLGFAVAASGSAKITGDVWEDADPDFNNFSYRYKVSHIRVATKAKLVIKTKFWIQPYLSASAGVGFNQAGNFVITPKIFEEIPAPGFASHTATSFSYTAGTGVQIPIKENWQIGVGYEFADWGKSRLNRAEGQTLNTGLSLKHLYTNQLQFTVAYVANA